MLYPGSGHHHSDQTPPPETYRLESYVTIVLTVSHSIEREYTNTPPTHTHTPCLYSQSKITGESWYELGQSETGLEQSQLYLTDVKGMGHDPHKQLLVRQGH